jgi:hypothetical protein
MYGYSNPYVCLSQSSMESIIHVSNSPSAYISVLRKFEELASYSLCGKNVSKLNTLSPEYVFEFMLS